MYDIVIIGGGPAGMTAALYALRGEKRVLILEKSGLGGQITASNEVENYPAIKSICGKQFADNLSEQIKSLGVECSYETATEIKRNGKEFIVETLKNSYFCRSVIIASGTRHRGLGLENEGKYTGVGISYCALCDSAFFKNKAVAVVGGGNSALHDADYLASVCSKVYLIHRRNELRGEKCLAERLKSFDNVEFVLNSSVTDIEGNGRVEKIAIINNRTNTKIRLNVDGVFIAVGSKPQNEAFKNTVELDCYGYIIANEDCKTNVEGIFAAGDCRKKSLRQLTTAVSDGAFAAVGAMSFIEKSDLKTP